MFRAAIFDLDGVLADTEPFWRSGFRTALRVAEHACGRTESTLSDEQLAEFEGGRASDTVRSILSRRIPENELTEGLVQRATDAAVVRASRRFEERPSLLQPAVSLVRTLSEQWAITVAVASSSPIQFIDAVLDVAGIADIVPVRESAFELQVPKPHPEVYLRTLKRLAAPARSTMAIEDSVTGVRASLAASISTIWLPTTPGRVRIATELQPSLSEQFPDTVVVVQDDLTMDSVRQLWRQSR